MDKVPTTRMESDKVGLIHGITYASPILVTSFLFYPVQMLLAGMYAKYFGLALTTIATIVFAARLFDAVSDPLIGYFSDRYRARTGTRKPWIVIGSICLVISSYFLWVPPSNVSAGYFLGWYFAFYLAWTIIDIPHLAWGGELTPCGHHRTRVYSLRTFFWFLGALLFTVAALLPFFDSKGFTPETLKWSVLASALVILPVLMVCAKFTPDGRESVRPKKESPRLVLQAIVQTKPLLVLLAGFFLISSSYGLYIGLSFIYADAYLGLGEHLPKVFAVSTFVGLAGAGLVYKLSARLEKATIYGLAIILSALAMAGHALLMPGLGSLIPFALLTCMVYFGNAMVLVIVPSLLSDIADYGTWKFGADRVATYFSAYSFMYKAVIGMGGAFALALIGFYEFDAAATTQTENSIFGLRLAIAYLPALLMFASLILIARTPINVGRHTIIQRRLVSIIQRNEKE